MQTGFMAPARDFQSESLGQAQGGIVPQQITPMARASQRAGEAGQILGHLITALEKRLAPVLLPDSPRPTSVGNTQSDNGPGSMLSDALTQHAGDLEMCAERLRDIMDRLSL